MNKALYPRDNIADYESRKGGGSIEDSMDASIRSVEDNIKD